MGLQKLEFEPNRPVQVALKYAGEGKICKSERGYADQVYFTLAEPAGHCIYTALPVAAKITALAPQAGELFWIQKKWTGKKSDAPEWDVWPVNEGPVSPATGHRPPATTQPTGVPRPGALAAINGGRDERSLAALEAARVEALARLDEIERKKQAVAGASTPATVATPVSTQPREQQSNGSSNGGAARPPAAGTLEDALRIAVAAAHAAGEYARSIGYATMPIFTSEDLRALAISQFIQTGGRR